MDKKKKVLKIPASAMKSKGNQKSFSLDNIQVYLMEEYSAIAELSARKEKVNAMWAKETFLVWNMRSKEHLQKPNAAVRKMG